MIARCRRAKEDDKDATRLNPHCSPFILWIYEGLRDRTRTDHKAMTHLNDRSLLNEKGIPPLTHNLLTAASIREKLKGGIFPPGKSNFTACCCKRIAQGIGRARTTLSPSTLMRTSIPGAPMGGNGESHTCAANSLFSAAGSCEIRLRQIGIPLSKGLYGQSVTYCLNQVPILNTFFLKMIFRIFHVIYIL